jgi:formate dehydrogenase major subunit/formate dehydrogenase alpha subunit
MRIMATITLIIDGREVESERGATVLETAQRADIYIPSLCYHPDLSPAPGTKIDAQIYRGGELIRGESSNPRRFEGCQLCLVEIEGIEGFPTACDTPAEDGMIIHTNTRQILLPNTLMHA